MEEFKENISNLAKSLISRRVALKAFLASLIVGSKSFDQVFAVTPISIKQIATGTKSISFSINSSISGKIYIEYGTLKGSYSKKSPLYSVIKGSPITVTLTGLTPSTNIYYRVRYALGTSKTYLALTSAVTKTGAELIGNVFAVQADPHMDENSSADVYNGTLKQIVASSPAFLMDLGDIFMVDKLQDKSEKNIRARFELMKGFYAKL